MTKVLPQAEIDRMGRFLQAHTGHFAFAFVRVNDRTIRDEAISRLRRDFSSIQVIDYSEGPERWLLSDLRRRDLSQTQALFLLGLETTILTRTDFVRSLNHDREGFPEIVHCPMLMWLSDAAVDRMMREAPDFVDWHAAAFRLDEEQESAATFVEVAAPSPWSPHFLRERIRLLEEVLHENLNRDEGNQPLASILGQLAKAHLELKDYQAGLEYASQGIEILGSGAVDLHVDLLVLRAAAYRALRRFDAAAADYDKAMSLLAMGRGTEESELRVGTVLNNKGILLDGMKRFSEASHCYEEAAKVWGHLVERGRSEAWPDLASALMNRGVAARNLGRLEEALGLYDRALKIYGELLQAGHDDIREDIAKALVNKGVALRNLGRLGEAIEFYDRALLIREEIVRSGRKEFSEELAVTHVNRGVLLDALGKRDEALATYDQAISILEELVRSGRSELRETVATVRMNRAVTLANLDRDDEALEEYSTGLAIREALVASGRTDMLDGVARVLINIGATLASLRRLDDALLRSQRAVRILAELVDAGRNDLRPNLAEALELNHLVLIRLERDEEALALIVRAVDIRRQLHQEGFHHQMPEFQSALEQLAGVLETAGRNDEAARARAEAASLALPPTAAPV